jgi:hypothetical protein
MDLSYGDLQTDLKMNGRAPIKKNGSQFFLARFSSRIVTFVMKNQWCVEQSLF